LLLNYVSGWISFCPVGTAVPAAVRNYLDAPPDSRREDRSKSFERCLFNVRTSMPSGKPVVERAAKMPCPLQETIPLCRRGQIRGSTVMQAGKWGLAIVLASIATLSIGIGEAKSQYALLRICNQSTIAASAAVTAHPSPGNSAFVIRGWWTVPSGTCVNAQYVPWGWVYLYAQAYSGANIEWRGSDQRFCVTYPGPFERIISASYHCSGNVLKSFHGYFVEGETFTWNLN
jgi:uncharacterized membrane protein